MVVKFQPVLTEESRREGNLIPFCLFQWQWIFIWTQTDCLFYRWCCVDQQSNCTVFLWNAVRFINTQHPLSPCHWLKQPIGCVGSVVQLCWGFSFVQEQKVFVPPWAWRWLCRIWTATRFASYFLFIAFRLGNGKDIFRFVLNFEISLVAIGLAGQGLENSSVVK